MDFVLGSACWHVVGYHGEPETPVVLCGDKHVDVTDDERWGDVWDFLYSRCLPLCQRCDKATNGEAGKYINRVGNEEWVRS